MEVGERARVCIRERENSKFTLEAQGIATLNSDSYIDFSVWVFYVLRFETPDDVLESISVWRDRYAKKRDRMRIKVLKSNIMHLFFLTAISIHTVAGRVLLFVCESSVYYEP